MLFLLYTVRYISRKLYADLFLYHKKTAPCRAVLQSKTNLPILLIPPGTVGNLRVLLWLAVAQQLTLGI